MITLLPNSKSTPTSPTALSNSLWISWSNLFTLIVEPRLILLSISVIFLTTIPVCLGTDEPFAYNDTLSPIFKFELSGFVFKKNWSDDTIFSVSSLNLLAVLYNHELKNTVLRVLSESILGFGIFSPKFLTVIFSPSRVTLDPSDGNNSKSDNTPVILNSTLLVKSPSSYPNINSSLLISSVDLIELPIPVQFKNWFIVLSLYVIVFIPFTPLVTSIPVVPNPTVESTVSKVLLIGASSITLVLPGIVNVPWIPLLSSYPTNKFNL